MQQSSKSQSVILFSLVGLIIFVQIFYGLRTFDDAFITYRYARNISMGYGFVYNLGQRVLGTTTPLFALLLAVIARILQADQLPLAAFSVNLIAEGINVILIYRLCTWIFQDQRLAVIIPLAYIFQPLRLDVSSGGMETSLYISFLLLMYYSFFIKGLRLPSAIWAAFAFLTRPDGLIAILPVFVFWYFKDRKTSIKAIAIFSILIAPWLIFSTLYFGNPLPNTILAKSISYRNPAGHAMLFLATFFGTGSLNIYIPVYGILVGFLISLVIMSYGSYKLIKSRPELVVWVSYPLLFSLLMSWQNPAMWFPWYYVPLLTVGIIMYVAAIWFFPWKKPFLRWVGVLLLIALFPGIPFLINKSIPQWDPTREREKIYWEACHQVRDELIQGDLVLTPDIGVIGWCLDQADILDPIGLVSPEAIPYQRKLQPGQWVSSALIHDFSPKYIISFDYYLKHAFKQNSILDESYQVTWQKEVVLQGESRKMMVIEMTILPSPNSK